MDFSQQPDDDGRTASEDSSNSSNSSTAAASSSDASAASASHTDDAAPEPLRCLRSLVFSTNVLNNLSLGCTAPFLQHHLEVYYNEGYGSAGRIFAVFPLAALLCSPLASLLCRRLRKGKVGVWQLGLLVSVASTFFFGCSTSIPAIFLFRGLQGVGFSLTTVAGLGLLIERSPDLTADIGRQEMLVGLSFVIAPAVGGVLYTYVGFASIFLLLALAFFVVAVLLAGAIKSGMLLSNGTDRTTNDATAVAGGCLLQAVCCPLGRRRRRQHVDDNDNDDEEEGRRAPLLPSSSSSSPSPSKIKEKEAEEQQQGSSSSTILSFWGMLRRRGVLAAVAVVLMSFHSIGFLELTMAGHAQASLRLQPWAIGLLFSCVDAAYAVTGWCFPSIRTAAGGCRPLALAGLLCQALAFAALGPVPTPWSDSGGGAGVTDAVLAWGSVLLGCVLLGIGEGLAIIPAVDLMRMALPDTDNDGGDDDGVTASVAAMMSCGTSLGEFLGPLVGGMLMQYLPAVQEVGCHNNDDCETSFRWASTTVSLALLAVLGGCWWALSTNEAAVMTPRSLGEEEEEVDGDGGYWRLASVAEGEEDSFSVEGKPVAAVVASPSSSAAGATPTRPRKHGGSLGPAAAAATSVGTPSPKQPHRPRSRPPTPISFASIRVPSSSSLSSSHHGGGSHHHHQQQHQQQPSSPHPHPPNQHRRIRSAPALQAMAAEEGEGKATVVE